MYSLKEVFHFRDFSVVVSDFSTWNALKHPLQKPLFIINCSISLPETLYDKVKVIIPKHQFTNEFVLIEKAGIVRDLLNVIQLTYKRYKISSVSDLNKVPLLDSLLCSELKEVVLDIEEAKTDSKFKPVKLNLNSIITELFPLGCTCSLQVDENYAVFDIEKVIIKFNRMLFQQYLTSVIDVDILKELRHRIETLNVKVRPKRTWFRRYCSEDEIIADDSNVFIEYKKFDPNMSIIASDNRNILEAIATQQYLIVKSATEKFKHFAILCSSSNTVKTLSNIISKQIDDIGEVILIVLNRRLCDDDVVEHLATTEIVYIVMLPYVNVEKVSFIGRGSYGTVKCCKQAVDNELFALKKMEVSDDQFSLSLMKEVYLNQMLRHDNIMEYTDYYMKSTAVYIRMEYMENGSISSYIRKHGALSQENIIFFSKQILNGLEFMHSKKIIHRDIKGSTFLIDDKLHLRISDFGLSNTLFEMLTNELSEGTVQSQKGTFNWIAPEVILNEKYGTKVDIWSFGATLVEMVTGKPPYPDLLSFQIVFKIAKERTIKFTSPPYISPDLRNIIHCCLSSKPKDRPDCTALINKFNNVNTKPVRTWNTV